MGVAAMRMSRVAMAVRDTNVVVCMPMSDTVDMPVRRGSHGVTVSSEPAQPHDAQTGCTKDQTCYVGIHRTPSVLALEYRRRFGTTDRKRVL